MAQPSVAAFFTNRKRAALDDAISIKNRRLAEPAETVPPATAPSQLPAGDNDADLDTLKAAASGMRTRSGRTARLIVTAAQESKKKTLAAAKMEPHIKQPKLVQFIKKGTLSPRKQAQSSKLDEEELQQSSAISEHTPKVNFTITNQQNADNVQRGLRTPTKQILKDASPIKADLRRQLTFDEVKTKVSRSAKLQELKAVLARKAALEQKRKEQEERNRKLREAGPSPSKSKMSVQLKEFDTIELEVLTSPLKTFKTPTKLPPPTPDKHELMSPRHTDVSKRLLFSPAKNGSPVKLVEVPAYKRYASLVETSRAGQLPLPYKYRHLLDVFKGLDSVVAMFHNRKETITFKKLKPAVQRMLRKNFTESHLAQIKHIYPEAFIFCQMKTRNFGSVSKADYFQLIIAPNVEPLPEQQESEKPRQFSKINEDDVLASAQSTSMNPHVMTARMQRFQSLLLDRVMRAHDQFLRSQDPPIIIEKALTRWHPQFDLESCPEVELATLPQPPNVEKYSSAKDILSTARNLFNCATPMERAMDRYEAKLEADKKQAAECNRKPEEQQAGVVAKTSTAIQTSQEVPGISGSAGKPTATEPTNQTETGKPTVKECTAPDASSNLLKGLPKSLIEKIRAKQAAKALEAMTRRPSQDQEATKYSRLPELARHLRNVFVTERKGVLTLEVIIKKIQNSFRANLTPQEIEAHLKLLAKELPSWASFHEVRKTMYLKVAKDMDMNKIIEKLESVANAKSN
ncbi:DNA replication factor Cdt1 isoform X2 [Drosophila teissieri]|uniref:DNA replication factor Cdt1 isoform X1 n=1 Tax=Drosophila teissieri TaxID=7243 RepID=UPI001CBA3137|nr:DNA replication factor Cdt1 isoform X1 [Drosophila teissieri]XP_043645785.1 DNA replication factor Cdt1 isoform X2 [Drosophila teissieri]